MEITKQGKFNYFKMKLLVYLFFIVKAFDIPSIVFKTDYPREYLFFRTFNIPFVNLLYLKLIYSLADILIFYKLKYQLKYLVISLIFPSNLSSLENLILIYNFEPCYFLLALLDPLYLLILPNKMKIFSDLFLINFYEISLLTIGYGSCHNPSLSTFWYPSMCMIEQYSSLSYSIHLINSKYLISKEKRLFPLLKSNSNLMSFLPFILNSKLSSLYCIVNSVFEYMFLLLKQYEIVNSNFLYWITLIFTIIYVIDIKMNLLQK
jgi:hypothetical protein